MNYGFNPPPAPSHKSGAQPGLPSPPPPYQQEDPPPYESGTPEHGDQSVIIRNTSSGLVLDAAEYDVKLQHFNGSPAQLWSLEPVEKRNSYIIRNKGNGTVLDIEGGPKSGAHLITYESHGRLNQQWFINPDNTITSAAANLAVDVCNANCIPGNILISYNRHGRPNQQFDIQYRTFTSINTPCCCHNQHQKSVIIRNPKSGLVLDACDNHVKIQWYSGSSSQQWTLKCVEKGKFIIINVGNGKALDVEGGIKKHAKLITFPKHGKTNQQWYINADGTIQSPVDNMVLDICEEKLVAGNHIIAFPKHGGANQLFQLQHCS